MEDSNWSVIATVARPEYFGQLREWLDTATKQELKGLNVIRAVWKHKGHKRFKPRRQCSLPKLHQRRGSLYQEEFKGSTNDVFILSHRKLKDLPASQVLTPAALTILEDWNSLHDDRYYRNLMLTCLRGMAAVCACYSPPVTEHKANFVWKSIPKMTRASDVRYRSISQTDTRATDNLAAAYVSQSPSKPVFKLHRPAWTKGNGDILAMPGTIKSTSNYQDSFAAYYNLVPSASAARFASSVALTRMIPNP